MKSAGLPILDSDSFILNAHCLCCISCSRAYAIVPGKAGALGGEPGNGAPGTDGAIPLSKSPFGVLAFAIKADAGCRWGSSPNRSWLSFSGPQYVAVVSTTARLASGFTLPTRSLVAAQSPLLGRRSNSHCVLRSGMVVWVSAHNHLETTWCLSLYCYYRNSPAFLLTFP
jgi:hypothetical protein